MSLEDRLAEARRLRPIFDDAVDSLEAFLTIVTRGYVNKPNLVQRNGHEFPRFVTASPSDAVLLKFARVVSLNRALLLLIDNGFVQEQCIIQRALEETNEDIMFLAVNITGSGKSDKFEPTLTEFWKEDWEDPGDPVNTIIPRGFSRRGIGAFLNRFLGQKNPSLADGVHRVINSMYSGFTHGGAPHIMELYDHGNGSFITNGLLGTDRHLDYVIDASHSIYRSIASASAAAKAFGSQELVNLANDILQKYESAVGPDNLFKKDH